MSAEEIRRLEAQCQKHPDDPEALLLLAQAFSEFELANQALPELGEAALAAGPM